MAYFRCGNGIPESVRTELLKCIEYIGGLSSGTGTVKNFNVIDMGELTYTYQSQYERMLAVIPDLQPVGSVRQTPFLSSRFISVDDNRPMANVPYNAIYAGAAGSTQIYIKTTETDPDVFRQSVTGVLLAYPIT